MSDRDACDTLASDRPRDSRIKRTRSGRAGDGRPDVVQAHCRHRLGHVSESLGRELIGVGDPVDLVLAARILSQGLVVLVPDVGNLLDQVHHAPEPVFSPDRDLDRNWMGAEPVFQHLEAAVEIRPHAVHLVHVDEAWHPVLVR